MLNINDHTVAVMDQNKEEGFDRKCDGASPLNIVLLPPYSIKDHHDSNSDAVFRRSPLNFFCIFVGYFFV